MDSLWLTLFLGLLLTALAFRTAISVDETEMEDDLVSATVSMASSSAKAINLQPALEALNKKFSEFQLDINHGIPITPQSLASHLWSPIPQGLETTALQFLPRIPSDEFTTRQTARNLMGDLAEAAISIKQFDDHNLSTASAGEEDYFPIVLQAGYKKAMDPAGLDRSNLNEFRLAMEMARDSGKLTSRWSFPNSRNNNEEFHTVYYYPLYRGGVIPATVTERRAQLIGFMSATTRYPTTAIFDFLPQFYHGLNVVFTPALPAEFDELSAGSKSFLLQPNVKIANYDLDNAHFSITVSSSQALRKAQATSTRWWVLLFGILASISIEALLLWIRHQSKRIVALVNERTRDLAERTEALSFSNAALRESEQRYRMLAENISDVIYTTDINGICTYISHSIITQCGYASDECIGKSILSILAPESVDKAKAVLALKFTSIHGSQARQMPPTTNEYVVICKDVTHKTVETTTSLLWDENGKMIGLLGVMRDITARKQAEQEKDMLQLAYQQAQKMEAIGTLAGGVAHDFNNLLTGVLGHTDMLKQEYTGSQDAHRSLELIETAALRAQELTGQLLGFARKGKFMQVPVEINKVISDLIGLLERTVDKNILITRTSTIGKPIVLGDPGQISQIFLNLAVNARDAMPKGGNLIFKTEIRHISESSKYNDFELTAGDYCVVSVTDTGIGIPKKNIEHIFEPFFTDKGEGKGTGLGLAMVYGVVKNHKGAVNVVSEPGKGSTFTIFLPLHENRALPEQQSTVRNLVKGTGKIMLVDDQPIVRQVGEKMLNHLGYSVVTCENGVRALACYKDHWQKIDVVLIDMIMPEMGGLECLEELKKINPEVKVILCTGFSKDDITGKLNQNHIVGFIQKPYRLQELSEVIAGVKRHNQPIIQ